MRKAIVMAFLVIGLLLCPNKTSAMSQSNAGLCESDISLVEKAVETTAGDEEFSVAVEIASVLINRHSSKIYPLSMLDILNIDDNIRIDHGISVSPRSSAAVRLALMGTSPLPDATGAMTLTEESDIPYAEYLVIGRWCFYCE